MSENGNNEGLNSQFDLHTGPMGAKKTLNLLTDLYGLGEEEEKLVLAIKSAKDPRPPHGVIESRAGLQRPAVVVEKLSQIESGLSAEQRPQYRGRSIEDFDVIGIDELMFFDDVEDTYSSIKIFLKMGKAIVASSLDNAGNGKTFPVISKIRELKPDEHDNQRACQICKHKDGRHTCIYESQEPDAKPFDRETLDFYVPDDGTLAYKALCRACYDNEGERTDTVEFTQEIADRLSGSTS